MPNKQLQEKNLSKVKDILKLVTESLSREEFLESFKKVVNQILEMEKKLILKIDFKTQKGEKDLDKLKEEFNQVIEKAKQESDSSLGGFKRRTLEAISNLFTRNEVNKKLKETQRKANETITEMNKVIIEGIDKIALVRDGNPGQPGKDADEDEVIDKVLKKIAIPQTDEARIKAVEDRIKEFGENKLRFGGGGYSKIASEGHIVDDETPSGTVNSSNKTFTLLKAPNPIESLKLYVGGVRMRSTEDYTLSKAIITMNEAPETNSILLVDYRT